MMEDLTIYRLPWWCDPGPRRVHGRHYPLHHPQRQGPRYAKFDGIKIARVQQTNVVAQSARTTFSASSSPSVRPGDSDKRESCGGDEEQQGRWEVQVRGKAAAASRFFQLWLSAIGGMQRSALRRLQLLA